MPKLYPTMNMNSLWVRPKIKGSLNLLGFMFRNRSLKGLGLMLKWFVFSNIENILLMHKVNKIEMIYKEFNHTLKTMIVFRYVIMSL